MFFPQVELNFVRENVDWYLQFDFRAAYLNTDLHCILSGTEDREEEIVM